MYMNPEEIITSGLYNAAVALMDDDIREEIHAEISPCSELEFLTEYMQRHLKKYGIEFTI